MNMQFFWRDDRPKRRFIQFHGNPFAEKDFGGLGVKKLTIMNEPFWQNLYGGT